MLCLTLPRVGGAVATGPVVVGRALVLTHPVFVASRVDIALTHRPMSKGSGPPSQPSFATWPSHRRLSPALGQVDTQIVLLIHLKPFTRASRPRTACSAQRQAVGPVDPVDLVLASVIAARRAVAALVTKRVVRLPGSVKRHRTPVNSTPALRELVQRALSKEQSSNASHSGPTKRPSPRPAASKPPSRPALETSPYKARPLPFLMDALANKVRLLMAVVGLREPFAVLMVPNDVLTVTQLANTQPP